MTDTLGTMRKETPKELADTLREWIAKTKQPLTEAGIFALHDFANHIEALESRKSSALKELRTKVQKRRDYLESISEMDSTDYRANEAEMLGLDWVLENVL